jgi:hypothetical protein
MVLKPDLRIVKFRALFPLCFGPNRAQRALDAAGGVRANRRADAAKEARPALTTIRRATITAFASTANSGARARPGRYSGARRRETGRAHLTAVL